MQVSKRWKAVAACAWALFILAVYYLNYVQNPRYSAIIVSVLKKAVGAP